MKDKNQNPNQIISFPLKNKIIKKIINLIKIDLSEPYTIYT